MLPSIAIVEDSLPIQRRLVQIIQASEQFRLAGAASTLAEGYALLAASSPDVLLTDLGLPDGTGRSLITQCRLHHPSTFVLVLSIFGDEASVIGAIEEGAHGYLHKDTPLVDVVPALESLLDGGSPISPKIARRLINQFRVPDRDTTALSGRQLEILSLLARGMTAAEVGGLLAISVNTVNTHIRAIYRILGVNNRSSAIYEAAQRRLIRLIE